MKADDFGGWGVATMVMLLLFGWHPIGWVVLIVFGIVWLIKKFDKDMGD